MTAYVVDALDELVLDAPPVLAAMDMMSPYVWRHDGRYRMLMRGVPSPLGPTDPTGLIWAGHSDDGLRFAMQPEPAILPGPDAIDIGGVEDPTVQPVDDGLMVYFTGVDAARRQGALLVAQGPDMHRLVKHRVALQAREGDGNIKEATLCQTPAGDWRLFFEYAREGASRIGIARADDLGARWTLLDDPFTIRADGWDNWHLSTGPVVTVPGHDPVMFYNGATIDARWRIGWISFSADFAHVTARGIEPVLMPPPAIDRAATDIAFAASAIVEDGGISLWYSLEDRRLMRARIAVYGASERVQPSAISVATVAPRAAAASVGLSRSCSPRRPPFT